MINLQSTHSLVGAFADNEISVNVMWL